MYYLLDSQDNYYRNSNYSNKSNFFSLFLPNLQITPFERNISSLVDSNRSTTSANETYTIIVYFLKQYCQIFICFLVELFTDFNNRPKEFNFDNFSYSIFDFIRHQSSAQNFEYKIFIFLLNSLLLLAIIVLVLWCIFKNKINFYYINKGILI